MQPGSRKVSLSEEQHFITTTFQKFDCTAYVPANLRETRCGCGRPKFQHALKTFEARQACSPTLKWSTAHNATASQTDAYGIVEFPTGKRTQKSQFVRLAYNTDPDFVMQLFEHIWAVPPPQLLISVRGTMEEPCWPPETVALCRCGLFKAAQSVGAWITTFGFKQHTVLTPSNMDRHLARKVPIIGISAWGMLRNRYRFLGQHVTVRSMANSVRSDTRLRDLSDVHNYFLFVDNGTIGRPGAERAFRRSFEGHIAELILRGPMKIPVVCLVLGGDKETMRDIMDCVLRHPPVPVVLCCGSGRAANLIAFALDRITDHESIKESTKEMLMAQIVHTFACTVMQAEQTYNELVLCVRKRSLITVLTAEDIESNAEHAFLCAFLTGLELSAPERLALTILWNRTDVARSSLFVPGSANEWTPDVLEAAMTYTLASNQVEFIKLLLENGISMQRFLTYNRLEDLYNCEFTKQTDDALRLVIMKVKKKKVTKLHRITLQEVGRAIQVLVGGSYRSLYCQSSFKRRIKEFRKLTANHMWTEILDQNVGDYTTVQCGALWTLHAIPDILPEIQRELEEPHFAHPFSDLLAWAVLTGRHATALCMWEHGEHSLAKGLLAYRLYKSMARESEGDDFEATVNAEQKEYAMKFDALTFDLLDECYRSDDDVTYELLATELSDWSKLSCLSLAATGKHVRFVAHHACQRLLENWWQGALRLRRNPNIQVLLGLLIPPLVLRFEFKPVEEAAPYEYSCDCVKENSVKNATVVKQKQSAVQQAEIFPKDEIFYVERELRSSMRKTDPARRRKLSVRFNSAEEQRIGVEYDSSSPETSFYVEPDSESSDIQCQHHDNIAYKQKPPVLLRVKRKFARFYNAPITKFWISVLAYSCFLIAFTYTVLTVLPNRPRWPEIFVTTYVLTNLCELLRQLWVKRYVLPSTKHQFFFDHAGDMGSLLASLLFIVALILRFSDTLKPHARVLYILDVSFWILNLISLLNVSRNVGPYLLLTAILVARVIHVCVILVTLLMAFGVARQSIMYPNEEFHGQLIRNIFYKPFMMWFKEVYWHWPDNEKFHMACTANVTIYKGEGCGITGYWLLPLFEAAFLLFGALMLVSLLVAMFNYLIEQNIMVSEEMWKFQRYYIVLCYKEKLVLPPPFVVLQHLHMLAAYCTSKYREQGRCPTKQTEPSEDALESLDELEQQCMIALASKAGLASGTSQNELIRKTDEKVDFIARKMEELSERDSGVNTSVFRYCERYAQNLEDVLHQIRGVRNLISWDSSDEELFE